VYFLRVSVQYRSIAASCSCSLHSEQLLQYYLDNNSIGQLTCEFVDGQKIGHLTGEFVDGQTIGHLTGEFVDGQTIDGQTICKNLSGDRQSFTSLVNEMAGRKVIPHTAIIRSLTMAAAAALSVS
jgi:hypothetical protein